MTYLAFDLRLIHDAYLFYHLTCPYCFVTSSSLISQWHQLLCFSKRFLITFIITCDNVNPFSPTFLLVNSSRFLPHQFIFCAHFLVNIVARTLLVHSAGVYPPASNISRSTLSNNLSLHEFYDRNLWWIHGKNKDSSPTNKICSSFILQWCTLVNHNTSIHHK